MNKLSRPIRIDMLAVEANNRPVITPTCTCTLLEEMQLEGTIQLVKERDRREVWQVRAKASLSP